MKTNEAFTAEELAQWLSEILLKNVFDHQKGSFACITIAVDNVEQQEIFERTFQKRLEKD
jgi:hypothetical protein